MKYKNKKYRSQLPRHPKWDYRWDASYFITICTKDREHFFDKVENGIMILSPAGEIAHQYFAEIPQYFPFVELDSFQVMPNHVHGIITINKDNIEKPDLDSLQCNESSGDDDQNPAKIDNQDKNEHFSSISPKPGSLATIIRSYKSACTEKINKIQNDFHFQWQSRFHDHIIRDYKSYLRISEYIKRNPKNWKEDNHNIRNNK